MRGYFLMNKSELNNLNSESKDNANAKHNISQGQANFTDLANAQSTAKNSNTTISDRKKISLHPAPITKSTSVDIKVPKQVAQPDLFKTNFKNVADFNSLVKSWENNSEDSKQDCGKNSKKTTVKINHNDNECTIELNGRTFPFHPFNNN